MDLLVGEKLKLAVFLAFGLRTKYIIFWELWIEDFLIVERQTLVDMTKYK